MGFENMEEGLYYDYGLLLLMHALWGIPYVFVL